MSNRKITIIYLIAGSTKKYYYVKMSYFPLYGNSKNKIEVELDLPNYATKSDLKTATGVDTSQFAKKDDLANLKTAVNKLNIDKFEILDADKMPPVPTVLINLSVE